MLDPISATRKRLRPFSPAPVKNPPYRLCSTAPICERVRGSSQSLHASPSKLNASTARTTASAGKTTMCGASNKWFRASLSIAPQLGIGASTPKPKKLSVASARIAPAIPMVACTSTG